MRTDSRPGIPETDLAEFLAHLAVRGASSYTVRSYRLGLADFGRWLVEHDAPLTAVKRGDITAYIDGFARGDRTAGSDGRRPAGGPRAARTINHRLSVLGSFFAFLIRRDDDRASGSWVGRSSPVPAAKPAYPSHGMPGRDLPLRRGRAELRRRVPRRLPADLDPELVRSLIEAAVSWRDTSILLLLATTGQRIGDWSDEHGRHGILGMSLADLDRRRSAIVVRLKGARDEHRVPVVSEFWAAFDRYLTEERGEPETDAAWVGLRRGRGRPLGYSAFEASLRYAAGKAGVKVRAHMFRHTVAQHVTETSGLKVAQELLGHQHISTTADIYAHVDQAAMVQAVAGLETRLLTGAARATERPESDEPVYAFHYDSSTIEELDAIASPRVLPGEPA